MTGTQIFAFTNLLRPYFVVNNSWSIFLELSFENESELIIIPTMLASINI